MHVFCFVSCACAAVCGSFFLFVFAVIACKAATRDTYVIMALAVSLWCVFLWFGSSVLFDLVSCPRVSFSFFRLVVVWLWFDFSLGWDF